MTATKKSFQTVAWFHWLFFIAVFLGLSVITYFNPDKWATREGDYLPYLQIYTIIVAVVFALPLFGSRLAWCIFERFPIRDANLFPNALTTTELFSLRAKQTLDPPRLLYGLLGPFHSPINILLFLLPVSFMALAVPTDQLKQMFPVVLMVSWLFLSWGSLSQRWDRMIFFTSHYFFQGLPIVVSVLVIFLGMARILDFQYVSSVFDVAPFGMITLLVIMLYITLWLLDFLLQRPLQLQLMRILGAPAHDPESLDYIFNPPKPPYVYTAVRNNDRKLQVHSAGSLVVVGKYDRNGEWRNAFHVREALDVFREICNQQKRWGIRQPLSLAMRNIRRRIHLYRIITSGFVMVVIALVLIAVSLVNGKDLEPIVSARAVSDQTTGWNLIEELRIRGEEHRPAVLVAASGGGTRAALHTYAVLRGLAKHDLADNIVLASGVSGGGVALAYFAAHYDNLMQTKWNEDAWREFQSTMSAPFVSDVLESLLEPRVYGGISFGTLLKESFDRRFGNNRTYHNFTDKLPFGLILNTTITAHPYQASDFLGNLFGQLPKVADQSQETLNDDLYTTFRGGRLVLTNLNSDNYFPSWGKSTISADIFLPYRVIRDSSVKLVEAAALTANFPPVFQDGLVTIRPENKKGLQKYKVTDGGATDNRGLLSLLYPLRHAIRHLAEAGHKIPAIYVVVAEASAFSFDYTSERGLGAALSGAKEVLANGLLDQLFNEIRTRGQTPEMFYLPMPSVFRTRGGLGTHWLLPSHISVSDPRSRTRSGINLEITKKEFKCLLEEVYSEPRPECTNEKILDANKPVIREVRKWICKPQQEKQPCQSANGHAERWRELKTLGSTRN